MKLSKQKLKQMIKEELEDYGIEEPGPGLDRSNFGSDEENAAIGTSMEREYANALGTILGLGPEEVAAIDDEAIGDIAQQIRQAYQSRGREAPPLGQPGLPGF